MIKSLEIKNGESILALEGIFIRFGKMCFKSYLHPLPDITLEKWAKQHSTSEVSIDWGDGYFITTCKDEKQIHYYSPSGIEGLIKYLARYTELVIRHYGDNSVPIVLSRKMKRA